jgi:hypothetical protein
MSALTLSACKVYDPLYCDEEMQCSDPERPFCDIEGEHPASEGVGRTCIPTPEDAGPGSSADGGGGASPDGDPAGDARPPCSWSPLSRLANVNSTIEEGGGSIDSEGLVLYFTRSKGLQGDVYRATRPAVGQAFGQVTLLEELADAALPLHPEVSPSQLEMFYVFDLDRIEVMTRATPTSPFGASVPTGFQGTSPSLSGDGLALYFTSDGTVFRSTRAAIGAAWSAPVTVLPTEEHFAVDVSPDELRLLLTSESDDTIPMAIAERKTTDDDFGPPAPVNEEILVEKGDSYRKAIWDGSQTQMIVSTALVGEEPDLYYSVCQ